MRSINHRADLAVLLSLVIGLTPAVADKDCSLTSTGLTPLTELGAGQYLGHEGGLYPGGANDVPADHLELGLDLAGLVQPRDELGNPEPEGAVGVISIGVSNTMREFSRFMEVADVESGINPRLVLINGAQGGQGLEEWSVGPEANPWFNLAVEVAGAGLTSEQVQVAWVKVPDRNRGTPDLERADAEIDRLADVVRIAKSLYPNLRLAYASSRIYGGYGGPQAEPTAYQNGFAVKMLIERQIEGDPELNADPEAGTVSAPWLAWGPYLWADGLVPRSDGLIWECNDFDSDGIHPNSAASNKVAELLMHHFSTHPTTTGWFLGDPAVSSTPTTTSAATTTSPPISTRPSANRPADRTDRVPPDQRPGRAQPESPPPAPPSAASGPELDLSWLIAGAAVGFGVSLTLIVARGRPGRRGVDRPDDL